MFWKLKRLCSAGGLNSGKMSEQELRKAEESRHDDMRIEYQAAMRHIDLFLSHAHAATSEEKCAILDYAIKAVKRDLVGESLSQIVYGKDAPEWRNAFPFPFSGEKEETVKIDLSNSDILVTPWEPERLSEAICTLLHTPFDCREGNYTAVYYPEIDLAIIGNGMHHSAAASLGSGGIISGSVFPLTPSFEHFDTDGALWIGPADKPPFGVIDFRFALLYTLAKMRYELK